MKSLCQRNGFTLGDLLSKASVSKTAFYSLARKDDILPRTITAIAAALNAKPGAFLEEESPAKKKTAILIKKPAPY